MRKFTLAYKEKVGHDVRKITYNDDMPAFYTVCAQSMDAEDKEGSLVEVGVRKVLIYEKKESEDDRMPEKTMDEHAQENLRVQQLQEPVMTQLVEAKLCTRNGLPVLTLPVMEEFREYPQLSYCHESYVDGVTKTAIICIKVYFHYVVGIVAK